MIRDETPLSSPLSDNFFRVLSRNCETLELYRAMKIHHEFELFTKFYLPFIVKYGKLNSSLRCKESH